MTAMQDESRNSGEQHETWIAVNRKQLSWASSFLKNKFHFLAVAKRVVLQTQDGNNIALRKST